MIDSEITPQSNMSFPNLIVHNQLSKLLRIIITESNSRKFLTESVGEPCNCNSKQPKLTHQNQTKNSNYSQNYVQFSSFHSDSANLIPQKLFPLQ